MALLDLVRMNVLEVVSHPCTYETITLPHLTVNTTHTLSRIYKQIETTKHMLKGLH